jgi:hypothetical protein
MAKPKSGRKSAAKTRQQGARGVAARRAKRRRPAARKAKAARKTARSAKTRSKGARKAKVSRARSRAPKGSVRTRGRKTSARAKAAGRRAAAPKKQTRSAAGRTKTTRRGAPLANPRGSSGPGTNPFPTKRSTGTGAGAGASRSPYLERERKRLREEEEEVHGPPSSLDLDRSASAVRSGREELREALHEHTETSPALTGGDIDADWQGAYAVGDEAPGGDNPTPDQDRVDDIGKALGLQYDDNEELKAVDKITERDRHRWELDPASAEDYRERQKK